MKLFTSFTFLLTYFCLISCFQEKGLLKRTRTKQQCFKIASLDQPQLFINKIDNQLKLGSDDQLFCLLTGQPYYLVQATQEGFIYLNADGVPKEGSELVFNSDNANLKNDNWIIEKISTDSTQPSYTIIRNEKSKDYFLTVGPNNKIIFRRFGGAGYLKQGWLLTAIYK